MPTDFFTLYMRLLRSPLASRDRRDAIERWQARIAWRHGLHLVRRA